MGRPASIHFYLKAKALVAFRRRGEEVRQQVIITQLILRLARCKSK